MFVETTQYVRKPLFVDAVQITDENFDTITKWCSGRVRVTKYDPRGEKYIKVAAHNPRNQSQTRAYVGDWMLRTERGFKIYTDVAFKETFILVNGPTPDIVFPPYEMDKRSTWTFEEIAAIAKSVYNDKERRVIPGEFVTGSVG